MVSASIEVYTSSENLEVELIKEINFSDNPLEPHLWQSVLVKLPESEKLQQIIIKGIRKKNRFSGMAIDDVTIRPCNDFRKFITRSVFINSVV